MMVGAEGFEPTHPKELIYSQPQLSNFAALPYMVHPEGLEPPYSNYVVNDRLEGGDDTGA